MDVTPCDRCHEEQKECPGPLVHCIVYGDHCSSQDAGCAAADGSYHPSVCCICKEKL